MTTKEGTRENWDMLDAAAHLGLGGGGHQNARAWRAFHERQISAHAETLGRLLAHHRAAVDHYGAILGVGSTEDGADGPTEAP
jgi:hypothetical protein